MGKFKQLIEAKERAALRSGRHSPTEAKASQEIASIEKGIEKEKKLRKYVVASAFLFDACDASPPTSNRLVLALSCLEKSNALVTMFENHDATVSCCADVYSVAQHMG